MSLRQPDVLQPALDVVVPFARGRHDPGRSGPAAGERNLADERMPDQRFGGLRSALHDVDNARWEALHDDPPVCLDAVSAQAAERLRRASA